MAKRLGGTWAILAVWCLMLPAASGAQQPPRPDERRLPDYDSRAVRPDLPRAPAAVEAALARLRDERGVAPETRRHPISGAVRRLSMRAGSLTGAAAGRPSEIAAAFVRARRDLFGLSEADADGLVLAREYSSVNERLTHVYFQQTVGGIDVFEGTVGVHLDRDGSIVWVTNDAVPARGRTPGPVLAAEDAVRAGAADIRPDLRFDPVRRAGPSGADQAGVFEPGPFARPIAISLVYFPTRDGLRLAWQMRLDPPDGTQAYRVIVDAADNRVLYRRNLVHDTGGVGRVFQSNATVAQDPRRPEPQPTGATPSGTDDPPRGCPPPDAFVLRSLTTPFRDPGSVLFDTGRLAGNDTTVYRGGVGAWGALGASVGGSWQFDFPFNTADSAETSAFFALNFAHDFFYDLGFDEAAGNFQVDNFGRGGVGGDPLVAIARASGRNNANIEVPAEGQSATMNLFLWDGQGCWAADVDGDGTSDLDGAYDNDIIIHEYHHGVSIRLNPAWSGDEAGAIGEGGGDFFAYSVFDDPVLAEYAAPPSGIRRVNAKTYADWFCLFGLFCEVHDNGEIWANLLWDLRERFRADLVGGSDAAAIRDAHQLYIDGLKLSPAGPTMLDMRDAMLQADRVRHPSADPGGSADYCRLWQVFARRGMGANARDTKDTFDHSVVADTSVPAVCPGPPVVTIAATTTPAREAGTSAGAFTVARTGDTSADLAVDYTVSGSATAGADYVALPGQVTIPAGASSALITVTPVDDTPYEPDESVVVALAAGPAYIVGSPSGATVTIVSDDLAPDLAVIALTAPATAAAGAVIQISDTTANRGAGAAGTFVTRIHLSTNLVIDPGDRVLGEREIAGLAGGAASPATTGAILPAGTAPGLYYVLIKADADARVSESIETNNVSFVTMKVGPDLIVSSLSAPATAGAGSAVTVTDTTTNQGAEAAGSTLTRFFLSNNVLLDADDRLLDGSRSVGPLGPTGASTGTTTVTIPADVATGQYFLLAQADAGAAIAESSETNNVKYATIRLGPDLAFTALTAPATAGPGTSITVTDTVTNQGGGAAAASVVRYYLSLNSAIDSGDTRLDLWRAVPLLAAGATSTGSTVLQIPAGTTPARYFLIAAADADQAVGETAETNNTRYVLLTIGSDLVVESLTAPATSGAGASLAITDTTFNQGGGAVPGSTTRFYLSVDSSLSPDDLRLSGGRAVPPLAAGARSTGTTVVTVPAELATGAYYLMARADADADAVESDENNNTRSRSMTIGPDLAISSLSAPSRAGAGSVISVSDTTTNQGGGAAPASTTRFYLSLDYRLDAGDVRLEGSRSVPALAAGANSAGTTAVRMPDAVATGAYFLLAVADDGGAVAEIGETNNTRYASLRVGPDLVVTSLSAATSVAAGNVLAVTDTTVNQGGGLAVASATRFYLSTDAYFSAGDMPLDGARAVPALGMDAGSTGATTVTVPAGVVPGLYYLIAKADGDEAIVETFETNNTKFRSLQVTAPGSTP